MGECKEFLDKQKYLKENFQKVSAKDFYEDIFPSAERERADKDGFSNPIIAYTKFREYEGKKIRFIWNEIVFADNDTVWDEVKGNDFAVCSMCSYAGRRRTAKNAYKLHGICIDLDGVGLNQLQTFHMGVDMEIFPAPTYIANSGHGVHLYYVFENPVPLYPRMIEHLQRLKHGLTDRVWTRETSTYKPQDRQYQGIYQGFRMPDTCSKLGKGNAKHKYHVTAYKWWRKVSLEYLNKFVADEWKLPTTIPDYGSYEWLDEEHVDLAKAKEMYPEWYEKRIVKKLPAGRWVCNKGLYYWWLNKIQEGNNAHDGNRYNCIAVLFIMAVKCNIGKEFAMADALELVEPFNELTVHEGNDFTVDDVKSASKFYQNSYARYSINAIEAKTKIHIERRPSKKPRRPQLEHLKRIRAMQAVDYPNGEWRNKDGRPKVEYIVAEWQKKHPEGKKADCIRDTGLSKPTVYKWWSENHE